MRYADGKTCSNICSSTNIYLVNWNKSTTILTCFPLFKYTIPSLNHIHILFSCALVVSPSSHGFEGTREVFRDLIETGKVSEDSDNLLPKDLTLIAKQDATHSPNVQEISRPKQKKTKIFGVLIFDRRLFSSMRKWDCLLFSFSLFSLFM